MFSLNNNTVESSHGLEWFLQTHFYANSFCTDPVNSKICHGLISRDAVHSVLSEEGMENGLYLVRKSRQRINSFTLHVCLNNRVRNFEIKMNDEGKLSILPNATFESLLKLVYYYHKDKVCE